MGPVIMEDFRMTDHVKELLEIIRDESNCNVLDYIDETADLIESLAAERDALAERCRQLEARNDALIAKEVLFDEAIAAGAKMQRERDAAVEDLKLWYCFSCNNQSTPHCQECSRNRVRLAKGYLSGRDHYEWRGVKED